MQWYERQAAQLPAMACIGRMAFSKKSNYACSDTTMNPSLFALCQLLNIGLLTLPHALLSKRRLRSDFGNGDGGSRRC